MWHSDWREKVKTIVSQCEMAKKYSKSLALADSKTKNNALTLMVNNLRQNQNYILEQNEKDCKRGEEIGISTALLDRLRLTPERIEGMANSIETIRDLDDPVGKILATWERPNGLKISRVTVPLGVFGMIYEARPNVTADAMALGLKSGNGVVLRGSSSAYESNKAVLETMLKGFEDTDISSKTFQLLEDTSREGVKTFVQQKETLSLMIPRGGAGLIKNVVENSLVPTIETGVGNCHVYIDKSADIEKALKVTLNAKLNRPSVCCSCESVLIHKNIAESFLPKLSEELIKAGVEVRGCSVSKNLVKNIASATDEDWACEYLDLIISVKVVDSIEAAISHIDQYGSNHTDAIITEDTTAADKFTKEVDSAVVMVNASTRFTDGGEFGFGAEIGISTQKLHARGPFALPELTTYKYVVQGDGQIRS